MVSPEVEGSVADPPFGELLDVPGKMGMISTRLVVRLLLSLTLISTSPGTGSSDEVEGIAVKVDVVGRDNERWTNPFIIKIGGATCDMGLEKSKSH